VGIFGSFIFFHYLCTNKQNSNIMSKELTRTGVVGLELTREEVNDAIGVVDAIIRKAQCREVNQIVLDILSNAREELDRADSTLTGILELDEDEEL
jgi:hypothetical protein